MLEPPIFEIPEIPIPSVFQSIEGDIGAIAELALTDIAEDTIRLYQQSIVREGSVDTGHFLNTVRVQRQAWHERDIASDAFYSGVVRRKHTGEVIGPMFVEETIDQLGPLVQDAFEKQMSR